MRAIDADALRDRLQNLGYDDWNQGATTTWAEAFIECADMVNEQPTIESERGKGKWVGYDGDWLKTMCKCSECGAMIDINEKYRNFFCYHCGAMMEGE